MVRFISCDGMLYGTAQLWKLSSSYKTQKQLHNITVVRVLTN